MDYEDLDESMQEYIDGLKHGYSSIEYELKDALEEAKDEDDFKIRATQCLVSLVNEAIGNIAQLNNTTIQGFNFPTTEQLAVVLVDGGVVTDVLSEQPLEVMVLDSDTDGTEEERLITVDEEEYGHSIFESTWETTHSQAFIEKAYKAIKGE